MKKKELSDTPLVVVRSYNSKEEAAKTLIYKFKGLATSGMITPYKEKVILTIALKRRGCN